MLAVTISLGAQEAGDVNSDNAAASRPAESEILLNQDEADTAPAAEVPEAEAPLPGVGFGDFLRMILVLAFVIGLIYAFIWFLKKFTSQKAESEEIINLLSTRPLKGDAALHLVEVGSAVFLVGSSSNSINLISEIDDPDSINEIKLAASMAPEKTVSGGFAKLFRDRFGSGPVASATDEVSGAELKEQDPTAFLKSQKERLKDL